EYGFHLDRHRRGTLVVDVAAQPEDYAEWGALAKLVGESHQSYYAVPVFTGLRRAPTADQLKHLGAALASYGSMAMFHMVGVTPEARSLAAALGGRRAAEKMRVTREDIERVFAGYRNADGSCNFVVFSGPQLSLLEMQQLAGLFEGRK